MNEPSWITVPAHKILCVPFPVFEKEFDRLNSDVGIAVVGEAPALIRWNKNNMVFKPAKFFPTDKRMTEGALDFDVYLEEF